MEEIVPQPRLHQDGGKRFTLHMPTSYVLSNLISVSLSNILANTHYSNSDFFLPSSADIEDTYFLWSSHFQTFPIPFVFCISSIVFFSISSTTISSRTLMLHIFSVPRSTLKLFRQRRNCSLAPQFKESSLQKAYVHPRFQKSFLNKIYSPLNLKEPPLNKKNPPVN